MDCLIIINFNIIGFQNIILGNYESNEYSCNDRHKGMIGLVGKIIENKNGKTLVRVHNELWYAENPKSLSEGEFIKITGIKGLHLYIQKVLETAKFI